MSYIVTEQKVVQHKGENPVPGKNAKQNPLKSADTCTWFNKHGSVNYNYRYSVLEKKKLCELEKVFEKFDADGTGLLDMDRIVKLFESVGILTDKS